MASASSSLPSATNGGLLAQVDLFRAFRQGDAVEKGANLAFGNGAVEFIDQLALEQHLDRRNAADAEVLGEFRAFVGIDLGEMKRPLYSSASFSSIGLSTLHGSHHGAQKSTTTGTVSAGIRTLASNSSMETSNANSDMVGPGKLESGEFYRWPMGGGRFEVAGGRAGLAEPVVQPGRKVGNIRQNGTMAAERGDVASAPGVACAQAEPVAAGDLWLVIELGAERLGVTAGS
jgi:hypothetical protein